MVKNKNFTERNSKHRNWRASIAKTLCLEEKGSWCYSRRWLACSGWARLCSGGACDLVIGGTLDSSLRRHSAVQSGACRLAWSGAVPANQPAKQRNQDRHTCLCGLAQAGWWEDAEFP